MDENDIGRILVDPAIAVHRELGPGLPETVYEVILLNELRERGLEAQRQVPVAINFRGVSFNEGFRAGTFVESKVILELKSIENIKGAHKKQLLTYLKLTGMKLGYLLNLGEAMMKRGITRPSTAFLNRSIPSDLSGLARESKRNSNRTSLNLNALSLRFPKSDRLLENDINSPSPVPPLVINNPLA